MFSTVFAFTVRGCDPYLIYWERGFGMWVIVGGSFSPGIMCAAPISDLVNVNVFQDDVWSIYVDQPISFVNYAKCCILMRYDHKQSIYSLLYYHMLQNLNLNHTTFMDQIWVRVILMKEQYINITICFVCVGLYRLISD